MSNGEEKRDFSVSYAIEQRGEGDAKTSVLRGHAAVFDSLSQNLGGFREKIAPGAFDDVLNDDVRAVFNHDPNIVLGRSTAGTLRLGVDAKGLTYEVDLPDTTAARDLALSIERGDIDQSSFRFTVDSDKWEERSDGEVIRTVEKVGRLVDVSPVTYPAYTDATVAKRSLDEFKKSNDNSGCQAEINSLRLKLLKKSH